MSARDEAMRRREERAAELLEAREPHIGVPGLPGKKYEAKLHPKDRSGKWRYNGGVHELHVGGKHVATVMQGNKPNAKGDVFHVKNETGPGVKNVSAGSLQRAKEIAHSMANVKNEDVAGHEKSALATPKGGGAGQTYRVNGQDVTEEQIRSAYDKNVKSLLSDGWTMDQIKQAVTDPETVMAKGKASGPSKAPAAKIAPKATPKVSPASKAAQDALKPAPAGQEHGDWRDAHHNTGYSAAEYAQHHAQNEKFYAGHVQALADGPDNMSTKPSVGGPKITKHGGAYYVEHHDNVDANRPLWKSGKVPVLAGKFKTAKQAAAAAARMDTKDYMDQRRADREAKGMKHGDHSMSSAAAYKAAGMADIDAAKQREMDADDAAAAAAAKPQVSIAPKPESAAQKADAKAKNDAAFEAIKGKPSGTHANAPTAPQSADAKKASAEAVPESWKPGSPHPMTGAKAGNKPAPPQSLEIGKKVTLHNPNESYDQLGGKIHGKTATIEGYATPEIQKNQIWPTESYYVRLEGDPPGTRRVVDRSSIKPFAGDITSAAAPKAKHSPATAEAKIPGAGAVVNGKAGRWVKLNGKQTHIPHHEDFMRQVGEDHFTSPKGGTTVYKNGSPYSASKATSLGTKNSAQSAAGLPTPYVFDKEGNAVPNPSKALVNDMPLSRYTDQQLQAKHDAVVGMLETKQPTAMKAQLRARLETYKAELAKRNVAGAPAAPAAPAPSGSSGPSQDVQPHLASSPGRSSAGRLRNFGAMSDSKLLSTLSAQQEHNTSASKYDPAAENALRAEAKKRDLDAGPAPMKPSGLTPAQTVGTPQRDDPSGGAIPNYDSVSLKVESGAGGTTGAKIAQGSDGKKYLLKTYGGNQDRVANELAANAVYRALGVKVADAGIHHDPEGKPALAYPLLDGKPHKITAPSKDIGKDYMADALVANWDFIGLVDDNILWDKGGKPFRVDQGGTFQYRAQGSPKQFGPVPNEVFSMMSPQGGQGHGKVDVTVAEKRAQAAKIAETLTPDKVDSIMDAAPFQNEAMRNEVRQALKDRVVWMGRYAKGEKDPSVNLPGDDEPGAPNKPQVTVAPKAAPVDLTKALQDELAAQKSPPKASAPSAPSSTGGETLKPELHSPARSSAGRLRNFQAMSTDKLTQTLVATTAHGNDPEALQGLQAEAAKRLGVQVPALAQSLAPKPATAAPSAPSAPAVVKGQERGATIGGWHSPPYDPDANKKAGLPDYAINPADYPLLSQEHSDAPRHGPLGKYLSQYDRNIGAVAEPAYNQPGMTAVTFDGKPASGTESSVTVTVPDSTPLDHLGKAVSDFANLIDNSSGGGISEHDGEAFAKQWSLANPNPPKPPAPPPAPVLPDAGEQSIADSRIKKLTDQIVMSGNLSEFGRNELIAKRKAWQDYKAGKGPRPSIPGVPSPSAASASGQAAAKAGVVAPSGGKAVETFAPEGPALDPNFIGSPGRSGAGRLRNFKQMANGKLLATEEDLDAYRQSNEKDYDAENLVAAEINRRINAGTLTGKPRSVAGKILQATFTQPERAKLAAQGKAMPSGGFPIRNAEDLGNAIHAVGRANDPAAAKAWIKKRAKDLGLESRLPTSWKVQEAALERRVERRRSLIEAADSLAKASTPEPFSTSKTSNWVARSGGLPAYIQHIAHDLIEKRGMAEGQAIGMAIGIVRRWARGGGNVDAGTRAAAQKAVAEFEALRARNAARKS